MKLSHYMSTHSISPDEMAKRIGGVSASGVLKWSRGERVPRAEQLRRIHEVTGGDVSPNDFVLPAPVERVAS